MVGTSDVGCHCSEDSYFCGGIKYFRVIMCFCFDGLCALSVWYEVLVGCGFVLGRERHIVRNFFLVGSLLDFYVLIVLRVSIRTKTWMYFDIWLIKKKKSFEGNHCCRDVRRFFICISVWMEVRWYHMDVVVLSVGGVFMAKMCVLAYVGLCWYSN